MITKTDCETLTDELLNGIDLPSLASEYNVSTKTIKYHAKNECSHQTVPLAYRYQSWWPKFGKETCRYCGNELDGYVCSFCVELEDFGIE